MTPGEEGRCRLVRNWRKVCSASKFVLSETEKQRRIDWGAQRLEQHIAALDQANRDPELVASHKGVLNLLKTCLHFRAGTDWVNPFGPPGLGIYVLYGHPKCSWDVPARHKCNLPIMGQIGPPEERAKLGCYPIRSCHWYLGAHQDREDIPREFGEGSKGSRNIKWFCPICYTPYEAWAHLAKRIVVFGATPGCTEAFAAYIGETSNSQAAMITYLKGCALASRIGNRVPTPQDVLDAITALNEQCEKRLGNLANAYSLYSAQPADNPAHSAYRIICKHAALSLPHAGSPVKVLTYPEDTPVLASSDLDFILHFAACFVDLDSNQDNPGPRSAGRRAGWALREGAAKLLPGIAAVMAEGAAAAAAGAKGSQE